MKSRGWRCVLVILCLSFGPVGTGHAEEKSGKPSPPPEPPAEKTRQDTKAILLDATRASTARAAESASRQKAEKNQEEKSPEPAADSGVTELRPLPPGEPAANSEVVKPESTGGPLKNIHGTVYGETGSAGGAGGGSIGTSTKSGRTSVYVEGRRNRTGDPRR